MAAMLDVTHRSGGYEWLDVNTARGFYQMEIQRPDCSHRFLKGDIETVEDLVNFIGLMSPE